MAGILYFVTRCTLKIDKKTHAFKKCQMGFAIDGCDCFIQLKNFLPLKQIIYSVDLEKLYPLFGAYYEVTICDIKKI